MKMIDPKDPDERIEDLRKWIEEEESSLRELDPERDLNWDRQEEADYDSDY